MGNIKIDKLLSKKGWTGAEVGKALMASIVHDIRHKTEPGFKPLFSQSDFDKMEGSLKSDKDYAIYAVYRDLYDGLIDAYNKGLCKYHQFNNGLYRSIYILRDAISSESLLQRGDHIPYVMTEQQYKDLKGRAEATLRNNYMSFADLFFLELESFVDAMEESPENIPQTIREAMEATKGELATNGRALAEYNTTTGHGYYQLADGSRSDQMSNEEWIAKLREDFLRNSKLIAKNGEPADLETAKSYYRRECSLKLEELHYYGLDAVKKLYHEKTGEDLPAKYEESAISDIEDLLFFRCSTVLSALRDGRSTPHPEQLLYIGLATCYPGAIAEWHYCEEPPEGLSKFDLLISELYNGALEEDGNPLLQEFEADYPVLYKAIADHLKENIPNFRDLSPDKYTDSVITWGDLAEAGGLCVDFADWVTASETDILNAVIKKDKEEETPTDYAHAKHCRIHFSGIAIAKDPAGFRIKENGEYADYWSEIVDIGVNCIYSIGSRMRDDIASSRDVLICPALRYLYAFNALVSIIGSIYDIDSMDEVEISTDFLESQIYAYNGFIYHLFSSVYGTAEEKKAKRDIVTDVFPPIHIESLKPTVEAIEAVTADLASLGFGSGARKKLKKFDSLIEQLSGGGNGNG